MSDTLNQTEGILPEEELPPEEMPPEEELPEDELPAERDGVTGESLSGGQEAEERQQDGLAPEEEPDTENQEEMKDWLERTEQITIQDIKSALPQQDYHTLTIGEEQNGIRCLTIAKLRAKADIQSTGHQYDEAIPEVRLALLKLFVYELYAFVGESQKAEAAYQDYALIIKTSFGDIKTRTDVPEDGGPAVAAMRAPVGWSRHGC